MSNELSYSERREMWYSALESGEYKQTRSVLRVEDSYCCLGVACELYRKATGQGEWLLSAFSKKDYFLGDGTALPNAVRDWFGFIGESGQSREEEVEPYGDPSLPNFMKMNDSLRMSFAEIAANARANEKEYFNHVE